MDKNTKVSNHTNTLNDIVSELRTVGVKIEDEYKALRLILSLPSSYEHIKHVLLYGKGTLSFEEVARKNIAE